MNSWTVYLHKGTIVVPTTVKAEPGFWVEVDPVVQFMLEELEGFSSFLENELMNPIEITEKPKSFPKEAVVLKSIGATSWPQFAKKTHTWSIQSDHENNFLLTPERYKEGNWFEPDLEKQSKYLCSNVNGLVADLRIQMMQINDR